MTANRAEKRRTFRLGFFRNGRVGMGGLGGGEENDKKASDFDGFAGHDCHPLWVFINALNAHNSSFQYGMTGRPVRRLPAEKMKDRILIKAMVMNPILYSIEFF